MTPTIRPAVEADLPAINDIYNHYVLTSTCTYAEVPDSLDARRRWWLDHKPPHPVLVLDAGKTVVGWGSLSKFKAREGYRYTCENSVYLHHDWCGRGLGSLMLRSLIDHARSGRMHAIIASICATQTASIKLHAKHGFVEAARMREVGFKFGRWLDVVYLQLVL